MNFRTKAAKWISEKILNVKPCDKETPFTIVGPEEKREIIKIRFRIDASGGYGRAYDILVSKIAGKIMSDQLVYIERGTDEMHDTPIIYGSLMIIEPQKQ